MKNSVFNPDGAKILLERLEKIKPDAQRQWGKMNVSQMLAHLHIGLETARGNHIMKRVFIGKLFGRLAKRMIHSEKVFGKNSPTDKSYKMVGHYDFETERKKVMESLKLLVEAGLKNTTKHPHPFFGDLTPEEWGLLQWKHIDHHLRQFNA